MSEIPPGFTYVPVPGVPTWSQVPAISIAPCPSPKGLPGVLLHCFVYPPLERFGFQFYGTVTSAGKRVLRSGNSTWSTVNGAIRGGSMTAEIVPAARAALGVLLAGGTTEEAVAAGRAAGARSTPPAAEAAYQATVTAAHAAYDRVYEKMYPEGFSQADFSAPKPPEMAAAGEELRRVKLSALETLLAATLAS